MDKNANTSTNNTENFQNTPHVRSGAMSDAKSAIADKAAPAMDFLKDNFRTVQDTTAPYLENAESFIKRYPFYTIAGAAAVGALIGMALSRPSSRA